MIYFMSVQGGMDHSALVEWVWRYFAEAPRDGASSSSGGEGQPPSLMSKLIGPVRLSSEHRNTMHSRYIDAAAPKPHLFLQLCL